MRVVGVSAIPSLAATAHPLHPDRVPAGNPHKGWKPAQRPTALVETRTKVIRTFNRAVEI